MKCLLIRSALILAIFGAAAAEARAEIITLEVQALIDGIDQLIIQGNTLQWHHLDFAAVGRWGGSMSRPPSPPRSTGQP